MACSWGMGWVIAHHIDCEEWLDAHILLYFHLLVLLLSFPNFILLLYLPFPSSRSSSLILTIIITPCACRPKIPLGRGGRGGRNPSTYKHFMTVIKSYDPSTQAQQDDSSIASIEGPLIVIIRHGKTEYNKLGLFTGMYVLTITSECMILRVFERNYQNIWLESTSSNKFFLNRSIKTAKMKHFPVIFEESWYGGGKLKIML